MLLYLTNRQSATLLTNSTADAKAFLYICSPRVTKYINYLVLWLVWSYESFNVLNKHKVSNSTLKKAANIYKTLTVSKSTVPQLKLTQPLKGKISFTKGHFTKIFLFKLNTTNERCFYLWQAEVCWSTKQWTLAFAAFITLFLCDMVCTVCRSTCMFAHTVDVSGGHPIENKSQH